MLSWELIAVWVAIVIIVVIARRMNAGRKDLPPREDDG